jgi:hypothetical protein
MVQVVIRRVIVVVEGCLLISEQKKMLLIFRLINKTDKISLIRLSAILIRLA